jgi:hypothetical protein
MATGRLGANALAVATESVVYTVPTGKYAVFSLSVVNRNSATSASVRLALANATTATTAEFIEYDASIPSNGVLERTGLILDAGKRLTAYSSVANVSIVVYGIETTA